MGVMTGRERRERRHRRVRLKVVGTAAKPRLSVFRSNRGVFAQLIDDDAGLTLASADWLATRGSSVGSKSEQAAAVGRLLAERARAAGIEEVVFDRGGYLYHGRIKALADAAREGGLRF